MTQISFLGSTKEERPSRSVSDGLKEITRLDMDSQLRYSEKTAIEPELSRQLVSFQANKMQPRYRWFKYKEAFSVNLVDYLMRRFGIVKGVVLDPFAGMGTTLFAVSDHNVECHGIELLPIGQEIIETRNILEQGLTDSEIQVLEHWINEKPWHITSGSIPTPELRITRGAYPAETQISLEHVQYSIQTESFRIQRILRFALLCILEGISYTRKDGQYLRWDHRSGRRQGTKLFDKGIISSFDEAFCRKLQEIVDDVAYSNENRDFFPTIEEKAHVKLLRGSCLDIMPQIAAESYDAIITSPPYCNRYDYTRTYALELALLGINEQEMLDLRQRMLTCTVENRPKDLESKIGWELALRSVRQHELLQRILSYLEVERVEGRLNNTGIPRMVRGYFEEMACVISESARVLRDRGLVIMVNDNVRYAGASISVDLILSDLASTVGLKTEAILVLPNGKGNSSQQMGEHGREKLRKCVYIWKKEE